MHKRTKLIIIFALFMLTIQTYNMTVLASKNPNGRGKGGGQPKEETNTVAEIGIYADNQCTNPPSSIDWGILEPGSSKNTICFIKNEGNKDLLLALKTSNWNPKNAFKDIAVTWNYDRTILKPGYVIQVSLTLSTSYKTDFENLSVDITIVGSP
jgi:hypothetical protein